MQQLYMDDLHPGDVFESGEYALDTPEIKTFARQFDPQCFHLDESAAANSFFHGLAASGWHTAAVTMRLVVESVPLAAGIIGASVELSWMRPVRPGERLRVKTTVNEIMPSRGKPDRGIARMTSETLNQLDDICLVIHHKIVVFKRS
ncbi:MAG: MaoC family dehydratase [Desulfobulbaceae bacterium]|jgi:acyl dehydratase|nr:MaoC family dehydratase [Desulfobulbaceae bacterium]